MVRSGELVGAKGAGSGHLARYFGTHDGDLIALFPLCGNQGDLELGVAGVVDCKRCRQSGHDELRRSLLKSADLTAQLDVEQERIQFLSLALNGGAE